MAVTMCTECKKAVKQDHKFKVTNTDGYPTVQHIHCDNPTKGNELRPEKVLPELKHSKA